MNVRFEFKGGCRDGTVIIGEDDPGLGIDKNPAHIYVLLTQRGRVGTRFREPLPSDMRQAKHREFYSSVGKAVREGKEVPRGKYPPDYHVYEVADRRMGPDGISIRVDFVGEDAAVSGDQAREGMPLGTFPETLDEFRSMLTDPTSCSRRSFYPGLPSGGPSKRSRAFAEAKRYVRIIEAMTAAERRHPKTLVDRMARERIAQDAELALKTSNGSYRFLRA